MSKNSENFTVCNRVNVGFTTKHILAKVPMSVKERDKLELLNECHMLTATIANLQERSPLKYEAIERFVLRCTFHYQTFNFALFSFLMEELLNSGKIGHDLAENAKKEYCNLLDHIDSTVMRGNEVYKHLWEKKSVITRHFQDEVQEAEGIKNIKSNIRMLHFVRGARKHYHEYLDIKKKRKKGGNNQEGRKDTFGSTSQRAGTSKKKTADGN
ncbi:hypothetical protein PR048_026542 [Dryococelus australis]|uniref:Uncharacterized protein n=1 Tax=Dryococelus australis TaxID=614101 RepID=A0ABQ9GLL3_9NEOP|nr:hypothetical protein PR048_026542 [Dryococelus australis]